MPQTTRLTMKTMPSDDRPTEKLQRLGAGALTEAELLAVIIRSGTTRENALAICQRLLAAPLDESGRDESTPSSHSGIRRLIDASLEELRSVEGIGHVRAAQIKAAFELGLRMQKLGSSSDRRAIKSPEDGLQLVESEMRFLAREEFRAILLDSRNKLIRICAISMGTLNASIVHPRDLFREAVKANAAAIILVHNHPSGDSTPSPEDIETTKRFMEIGTLMGVRVVDHLVVAHQGSVSLRQLGLI